jgi:hypothetical protein
MFWNKKAKDPPLARPDTSKQITAAPETAVEEAPVANSMWRVVPPAEVARYPVCPSCRQQSPPGFSHCSRCHMLLPRSEEVPAVNSIPQIGEYLLRQGIVGPREVQLALTRQRELAELGKERRFGEILVEMGFASTAQVDKAATRQSDEFENAWKK